MGTALLLLLTALAVEIFANLLHSALVVHVGVEGGRLVDRLVAERLQLFRVLGEHSTVRWL